MSVFIVNVHGDCRDVPKDTAVLANDSALDSHYGFFEMPSRESANVITAWAKSRGIRYSVFEKKDVTNEF